MKIRPFGAGKVAVSIAVIAACGISTFSIPALAQGNSSGEKPEKQQKQEEKALKREQKNQDKQERQNSKQLEKQEKRAAKLEEKQLKACEKREKVIQSKMTKIADRGEKQLAVFVKISERTQAFYAEKGRTVANYDALISELNAKRTDAETAVESIRENSQVFTCEGEDPKATAASFLDALEIRNMVLKEYKTAVKNLIVSVKSAQGVSKDTTEGETIAETEGEDL